ncbi:MAG: methyltransferase [Sandaracinaceae bacterium]|nr:methyltransferase [Sandaracinaceae bacterium]
MGALSDLRRDALVRLMKVGSSRAGVARVGDLEVRVAPGVCHPAPFGGVSFAPLFTAALDGLRDGDRVLDLGTGCGIWALLAARAGGRVTATDLSHVDLTSIAAAATAHGLAAPRLLHGDLFAPVAGERFDRVLFNPPFHFGEPRDDAERAYLGGADGEVVKRFLREVPAHLDEGGRAYVILPAHERAGYQADLSAHRVRDVRSVWLPVLGRVHLLALG